MEIYDLKNVTKCYTYGKIISSLSNVLNKISKNLDSGKKPPIKKRRNRSLQIEVKTEYDFKNSIIFINCNCGFNSNTLETVHTLLNKFNEVFSKTNTYVFFVRGGY